ncbi:hypothetical protein KR044_008374 [Drosophila immigrans]|nr:hypothetical protein KR044_008374 [Drosophila immigrans]
MANPQKDRMFNGGIHATNQTLTAHGGISSNGHGLQLEHQHTRKFGTTNTISGQANIFDRTHSSMNATAYHTRNPIQEQFGAGLNMNSRGHSASIGIDHVPKHNMTTMNAEGRMNLMSSPSGNFSVDATANATRHMSGPFRGKSDVGGGVSLTYRP